MKFSRSKGLFGIACALAACSPAMAVQPATRQPQARSKIESREKPVLERFCEKVPPSVEELRIAAQKKELEALESKVKERIEALEALSKSTQEWIDKRAELMKTADQSVIAIYAKSDPEAAAKQLDEMTDDMAASILAKLNAQQAGAILGEMSAAKASKIVSSIRGDGAGREKKL